MNALLQTCISKVLNSLTHCSGIQRLLSHLNFFAPHIGVWPSLQYLASSSDQSPRIHMDIFKIDIPQSFSESQAYAFGMHFLVLLHRIVDSGHDTSLKHFSPFSLTSSEPSRQSSKNRQELLLFKPKVLATFSVTHPLKTKLD